MNLALVLPNVPWLRGFQMCGLVLPWHRLVAGAIIFAASGCDRTEISQNTEQHPITPNSTQAARADAINHIAGASTPDSLDRRKRSNAILRAEGVPLNANLPVIQSEAVTTLRSRDEVLMRARCLLVVSAKGLGAPGQVIDRFIADNSIGQGFSDEERAFLSDQSPSEQDLAKFSWRTEAAHALFWALGKYDKLGGPSQPADPDPMLSLLAAAERSKLDASANLRSKSEILDQADLIYRYQWAIVENRVNGKSEPAGLSSDVAMERHQAFNWLIGYMGQDWDDVSTDT